MKRRLLSAFLAVMMVLTMAPVAFAADGDTAATPENVAEINGTGYATLQAAVDAAKAGDTITLLKDITVDGTDKVTSRTVIDKPITLDLNDKTIKSPDNMGANTNNFTALHISADVTINATTGGINTGTNGAYAINVMNGATLTINGGNYYGGGTAVQVQEGTANINGGTFACEPYGDPYGYKFLINCIDSAYKNGTAKVSIKGGSFVNFDPSDSASENPKGNFCVSGYVAVKSGTDDAPVWTVEDHRVAEVGNIGYSTLAAAVAAAQSGATVKLLANINGQTVIPADKNIVLDLNGKTMTHTGTTLYNSGTLVVKDSSADKSGKIVSTGNVGIGVNHNSTTTIEYANIQAQEGAVITGYATGATITIEDGVFTALDNAVVAGNGNKTDKNTEGTPERVNANKITINGGTFTGNIQSSGYIACGIYAPWKDIITVNGGDFTVNNGIGIVARAGQVTVNGGRFICNGSAKGKVGDKKFDMDAAQILYFDASNPAYPAYNSATDYIKVTGGLFAAAFNNAYCADGKAVVPNTDAATKDVYPYTVGTVEENVEVSPAAPEAKAETTGKETTVADAMTSIAQNIQNNGATTEGLEAVGGQEANKVTTDEVTAAKTELAKTVSVADKTVTVYVQPYLDITVKDAKVSADNENAPYSVTLDIVPMVKKVASTAENADAIALSGNNKNAVVLENKEVTVTTPVTITIKLPDNFAISDVSTIKVKHEKNGVLVGYHDATVDKENRTVTFTNDKGFSTFTILSDSRSTSISFDGEAAVSYGPSNVNDALPTRTAPSGKVFKGWSFEGVNGTYTTLTDDLLTALDGKTAVKATSVFDNKSSGGSSGSSSGKTTYKVTTSAVNNGGVNASPSNAEKGATITLTLSPDKGYKLDKLTVTDGSGKSVSTVKKSDTVYTFTMPASAVTVGVSYAKADETPSKTTFNDVSANDWFASAVDYVTGKGMMNGTAANTFSPKANTTRGMLMTVLARHAGEDTTGGSVWYEKGMNWAKANGVSDGTNPQVNITREQLAAMLYRYAQNKKYDVSGAKSLDGYTDAQSVSSYAVPALQWANAAGVVNGKSGSKLDPKGYATRAEVAAMLMRFCENVEK